MQLIKTCTKCNTEKKLTEFYKSARLADGYHSACKVCCNIMNRKSMNKKPDHYKMVRDKERDRLNKKFMDRKRSIGCCFCGETEPVCLELHHKDPTTKEVAPSALRNHTWDKFMTEARKCIMVCSNCHKKIHAGLLNDIDKPLIIS